MYRKVGPGFNNELRAARRRDVSLPVSLLHWHDVTENEPDDAAATVVDSSTASPPWATFHRTNLLADEAPVPRVPDGVNRIILWSGWLDEHAEPLMGHFAPDARLWQPGTWDRLIARLTRTATVMKARGVDLILRPHAMHVVSDIPACLKLAALTHAIGVGVMPDFAGMMTSAMAGTDFHDHAERFVHGVRTLQRVHPGFARAVMLGKLGDGANSAGVDAIARELSADAIPIVWVG